MSTSSKDWHSFTEADLAVIEAGRAKRRASPITMVPGGNYKLMCPACDKPNTETVEFCTGCGFALKPEDLQRLPDNVFLELVKGNDIGAKVHKRTDDYIVFDDKFGVSDNHLDIIPCAVYDDIAALGREHIPILEELYRLGVEEFKRRNLSALVGDRDMDDLIQAGFNYPVSVKHLHLHMVLPPFKHNKVFLYPRWHSYRKVLRDLREHGRVVLYNETPNDAEGAAEYQRALDNHIVVGGKPFDLASS